MNPSPHRPVAIVSDTTASLPAGYAEAHGIPLAPQVILFGEESFLEEREITFGEFVRRLKSGADLPRTAAPPPGEFVAIYRDALAQADTVLSIHPSGEVSGTVRSAQTAKAEAFPDADIRIVDTRTVGAGLGTLVRLATEAVEGGRSADETMALLASLMPRSRTYFAIRTLEYLRRGGRIGRAAALAGSMLRIKPLLQLSDGVVAPLEKVRTHARALERLRELVLESCPPAEDAHPCVMEADAAEEAGALAETLRQALGVAEVPVVGVGSAITTHAGPGVLGVSFLAE